MNRNARCTKNNNCWSTEATFTPSSTMWASQSRAQEAAFGSGFCPQNSGRRVNSSTKKHLSKIFLQQSYPATLVQYTPPLSIRTSRPARFTSCNSTSSCSTRPSPSPLPIQSGHQRAFSKKGTWSTEKNAGAEHGMEPGERIAQ